MNVTSDHWEQSGALPMPNVGGVHYERNLGRLLTWTALNGTDGPITVNAPFIEYEGAARLGVNSDVGGAIKMPVLLEAIAQDSGVVYTSVTLPRGTMGRPLLGYANGEAHSHYGDQTSKDIGLTAVNATFFKEGYGMVSFEKQGNSKAPQNVTPEEVVGFMNICFDVARFAA